jgi:hypothetical protein
MPDAFQPITQSLVLIPCYYKYRWRGPLQVLQSSLNALINIGVDGSFERRGMRDAILPSYMIGHPRFVLIVRRGPYRPWSYYG